MILLSVTSCLSGILIIYFCLLFYQDYRKELIRTEQNQLLTMARTVGKSLANYMEEELHSLDLYFSALESGFGTSDSQDIRLAASYFLEQKGSLYDGMAYYDPDGRLIFKVGDIDCPASLAGDFSSTHDTAVLGKQLSGHGWYQMFLSRGFQWDQSSCRILYAMNLNTIYEQIVAPVQIGKGGYSIVKDSELTIIMHHAPDQIGIDAVYDRSILYPHLDLKDLFAWISMQQTQPEGCGVINSYVWDDPGLSSEKRIVAYTTVQIPGEKWIVNSTIPFQELDQPLTNMVVRLAAISTLFLFFIIVFVYFMTKILTEEASQRREIAYLKKINEGMELLRRKDEDLQRYHRMQAVGQMSSHIAHELNNYLTPVMIYGEILQSDSTISPQNQELISGIIHSVDQAADLSRRLLDFSHKDNLGTMTEQDLTQETALAAQVVRHMAPKQVKVQVILPDRCLTTYGNKGMMGHLLLNLCNNAFHAMEDNKKERILTIRLEHVEKNDIDCDMAVLSVSDTGCGIPKEALDKIFEPFYTTKRSGRGTGLGLSVVRNIMDSVNGQVRIHSEPGTGTTFYLSFPLVTPSEDTVSDRTGNFHKLIIVDDDPAVRKSLTLMLRSTSVQAECFDHPAAVLSLLEEDKDCCDIILTDYAMPSLNGLELAQMIRKINPRIYLVLMSGSDISQLEYGIKNGTVDRFIPKTSLAEELIPLLEAPQSAKGGIQPLKISTSRYSGPA